MTTIDPENLWLHVLPDDSEPEADEEIEDHQPEPEPVPGLVIDVTCDPRSVRINGAEIPIWCIDDILWESDICGAQSSYQVVTLRLIPTFFVVRGEAEDG